MFQYTALIQRTTATHYLKQSISDLSQDVSISGSAISENCLVTYLTYTANTASNGTIYQVISLNIS